MSLSAHQIHKMLPANSLLDSGIWDPQLLRQASAITGKSTIAILLGTPSAITGKLLNPSTRSVFLSQVAAHHLTTGIVFITLGLIKWCNLFFSRNAILSLRLAYIDYHAQLSINLATWASLSIIAADHLTRIPIYPHKSTDYPTILCLSIHHACLSSFLIIASGAHASIFVIHQLPTSEIRHRDPIIGHLIWVCIAIGLHSFSLYCHNDTLEALGRPEDIFHDNSIQLKAIFAKQSLELQPDIEMLDKKIIRITQELGTADFIVHHIHAFTIHVTLLILSKGVLYARNSRFVSDKLELGFTYPCDGPGRGGTCQISPWDHLFSAVFWMYNCLNVVTFHYFWKMQSDVWGLYIHLSRYLTTSLLLEPSTQ